MLDLWRWRFDFLLRRPGSPSLRESVSEWPQAHDGASTRESAWAWRFLAALLLPQGSVSASSRSPAHDAASRSGLALPGSTADAALRSVLASLGSLARHEGSPLGVVSGFFS